MKKLFYLKNKKEHLSFEQSSNNNRSGPFPVYQILKFVLKGQIQYEFPIYSEEDKQWTSLYLRQEFKNFFSKEDDNWTLLKKNNDRFVQSKNYSTKGLQTFLRIGFINDQDFVWKQGFSSWNRISVCCEFKTRFDSTVEDLMDQSAMNYKGSSGENTFLYKRDDPSSTKTN